MTGPVIRGILETRSIERITKGMQMKNSRRIRGIITSPYTALVLSALFWSGNFIVGRALKGEVTPLSLNFWRWVLALGVLLPLCLVQIRVHWRLMLSEWKLLLGLGFSGIAAFHILVYEALTQTTAINALIILSTSPAAIALLARFVTGSRISPVQAAGILVSLLGTLVLICRGDWDLLSGLSFVAGDLWMGAAVLLLAFYSLLLRRKPAALPQGALLFGTIAAGVLMMLPAYAWALARGTASALTSGHWLAVGYISLFASVLAFYFWNFGVARIGPVRAGMFIHLMPFFGTILSILLLGEGLALFHLAGGVLVAWGIVLTSRQAKTVQG